MAKKSASAIFALALILIAIDMVFLIFTIRRRRYRIDWSTLFYFSLIMVIAIVLLIVAWVMAQNEGYWPDYQRDYRSAIIDDPVLGGGSVYVDEAGYYPGVGWLP